MNVKELFAELNWPFEEREPCPPTIGPIGWTLTNVFQNKVLTPILESMPNDPSLLKQLLDRLSGQRKLFPAGSPTWIILDFAVWSLEGAIKMHTSVREFWAADAAYLNAVEA